jgi:hypothetical protein
VGRSADQSVSTMGQLADRETPIRSCWLDVMPSAAPGRGADHLGRSRVACLCDQRVKAYRHRMASTSSSEHRVVAGAMRWLAFVAAAALPVEVYFGRTRRVGCEPRVIELPPRDVELVGPCGRCRSSG